MTLRWDEYAYFTNGLGMGIYGNEMCEKRIVKSFWDQTE